MNGLSKISPSWSICSWVITKICLLGVGLVGSLVGNLVGVAGKVFLFAGVVFMVHLLINRLLLGFDFIQVNNIVHLARLKLV